MEKADIPFLTVVQLSELIKNRTVSPVDAVEAYLDRIDSLNGKLYAYLTVCRDRPQPLGYNPVHRRVQQRLRRRDRCVLVRHVLGRRYRWVR